MTHGARGICCAASSTLRVPPTLVLQQPAGSCSAQMTRESAARWMIPSTLDTALATRSRSRTSPRESLCSAKIELIDVSRASLRVRSPHYCASDKPRGSSDENAPGIMCLMVTPVMSANSCPRTEASSPADTHPQKQEGRLPPVSGVVLIAGCTTTISKSTRVTSASNDFIRVASPRTNLDCFVVWVRCTSCAMSFEAPASVGI